MGRSDPGTLRGGRGERTDERAVLLCHATTENGLGKKSCSPFDGLVSEAPLSAVCLGGIHSLSSSPSGTSHLVAAAAPLSADPALEASSMSTWHTSTARSLCPRAERRHAGAALQKLQATP